ncbi:MAG TPA: class I SAM-dependent methyltransferase [Phycisphaerae bacterium]|nr:class I SAM-dependent methyltransferase [Phycisphaerales bacterium]HRX83973.1 class I SAM-dependent methyltransferase [Phycisphaerae bacterium]
MAFCRLHQRLFACGMRHCGKRYRRFIDRRKPALFAGLAGDVLEVGYGAGANLPYLPQGIRYTGIEANPYMERHARAVAERHGVAVDLRGGDVRRLEFPNGSFDAVIATLVLCSVSDADRALAEIRRVLRPGGRFVFMEHVAAPAGSRTRRWQERTAPVWRFVGDGCSPARETGTLIQSAGFAKVDLEAFDAPVPVFGPHIAGFAEMPVEQGR